MNSVLTFLSENWQRLGLQRCGDPGTLSAVIVTPRFKASSHLIFFILAGRDARPALVVKVPRIPGDNHRLTREAENLRRVQESRANGFDSIPRVLAFEDYCGNRLLVETALPFETMRPALVRQKPDICTKAVFDWLLDLHSATRTASHGGTHLHAMETSLDSFRACFPVSEIERQLIAKTQEGLAELKKCSLPAVCEHADFSSPNILMSREGRIGVVDWELANPVGLPLLDLYFVLSYLAFAKSNVKSTADYVAAFRRAFWGPQAWTAPWIRRYCDSLQIDRNVLVPLFVLCWGRYVISLAQRLQSADSGGVLAKEPADWLRTNRYYSLWRYAVDHCEELTF